MKKQIFILLKGTYLSGDYWNSYYLIWFKKEKYTVRRIVTLKDSPDPLRDSQAQLKEKTYSITLGKKNASEEKIRLLYSHLLKEEAKREKIHKDKLTEAINSIYKIQENCIRFEQMVYDWDKFNEGML